MTEFQKIDFGRSADGYEGGDFQSWAGLGRWLLDEAKIETEQEEDEMDDGAGAADLGCFDKTCTQQRHRNVGEIEIEQNAR